MGSALPSVRVGAFAVSRETTTIPSLRSNNPLDVALAGVLPDLLYQSKWKNAMQSSGQSERNGLWEVAKLLPGICAVFIGCIQTAGTARKAGAHLLPAGSAHSMGRH